MLSRFQLVLRRGLITSPIKRNNNSKIEKKVVELENTLKAGQLEDHGKFPGMPKHCPNLRDKVFLVWSGHYRTIADVPNRIEYETMHKARTWGMIRTNLGMVFVGVCVCFGMVYLGKNAAKHGLTVEDQNLEWHKKINEEHHSRQQKLLNKESK